MSAHPIDHPPSADEVQRRGHMAALSVAERIVSISPVSPTEVKVSCPAFAVTEPSVDVHFFGSPNGVRALAEVLGVTATTRPFHESDTRLYVSMSAVLSGVPVLAWALMDGPFAVPAVVAR